MNNEQKRKWFQCSHVWCKEIIGKHKDLNYKAQLGLCMKELIRQKKNNEHNLF